MKMVTSKEAIDYVKRNLNKRDYVSMFVAGSLPKKLLPQSDLDIFFIVDGKYKNQFFDNLKKIMDEFVSKNKSVTYSFFRGPLKYKYKGLIHFLIFTHEKELDMTNKELFLNEHISVLKNHLKSAKIIYGKSLSYLLKNMNWERKDTSGTDWIKRKRKLLREENVIQYRLWKKTKKGWKFIRIRKKPSKFLKEYLLKYFSKHLQPNKNP